MDRKPDPCGLARHLFRERRCAMQEDEEARSEALPQWVRSGTAEPWALGGYACEDRQAMNFAWGAWERSGFCIPYFDMWLTSIGECGAQRELITRRRLAEDALREGKEDVMRRHLEWMYLRRIMIESGMAKSEIICAFEERKQKASKDGKRAADIRHDAEGGSRSKQKAICDVWASGKYTSKDRCAEQECSALGMSFSAARRALRNRPKPA